MSDNIGLTIALRTDRSYLHSSLSYLSSDTTVGEILATPPLAPPPQTYGRLRVSCSISEIMQLLQFAIWKKRSKWSPEKKRQINELQDFS